MAAEAGMSAGDSKTVDAARSSSGGSDDRCADCFFERAGLKLDGKAGERVGDELGLERDGSGEGVARAGTVAGAFGNAPSRGDRGSTAITSSMVWSIPADPLGRLPAATAAAAAEVGPRRGEAPWERGGGMSAVHAAAAAAAAVLSARGRLLGGSSIKRIGPVHTICLRAKCVCVGRGGGHHRTHRPRGEPPPHPLYY